MAGASPSRPSGAILRQRRTASGGDLTTRYGELRDVYTNSCQPPWAGPGPARHCWLCARLRSRFEQCLRYGALLS